jgi:hypothetical protein
MRAHFKWIEQQYGLENASRVVLAGSSLGGNGVLYWIDYLTHMVTDTDKVSGILDSSIFTDHLFTIKIDNIKKLKNILQIAPPQPPRPANSPSQAPQQGGILPINPVPAEPMATSPPRP